MGRRQTGRLPEVAEHCAELGRLSTRQHALGSRLHGEGERERERGEREERACMLAAHIAGAVATAESGLQRR